jgi:cleavage and polyadenylation specificity factor subunit 1
VGDRRWVRICLAFYPPCSNIRRFEFGTNEIVNAVETVRLETLSTQSGNKDFLAVATSVYRGEDLAVRGCVGPSVRHCPRSIDITQTYIFEVADVVQDVKSRGQRHHKLKLLCREEAKGPVTALCGMNGYLVSSMGQKARNFETLR